MAHIRPTTLDEFFHPISTYVTPLCAFVGQEGYVSGTAVILAPGIAVAASHVVQDILKKIGHNNKDSNIELDLYVMQLNTGACWYVSNSSSWVGTDITVLSLVPRNDIASSIKIDRLPISVDPPPKSSTITALGYPDTKLDIPQNDSDITKLCISITPTVSEGKVLDIHRSFRDRANLPFPCFTVDAEFLGGMSGGAVFNENRELCGLVCFGGEGELKNYSHAVSIWPMSIIPVVISDSMTEFKDITPGQKYKVLELAKLGYINMIGHERIEFFKHENGSDGVRRHHEE